MMNEDDKVVEIAFKLTAHVRTKWTEAGLKGYFHKGTVLSNSLMDVLYNYFVLSYENQVVGVGIEFLGDDYDSNLS